MRLPGQRGRKQFSPGMASFAEDLQAEVARLTKRKGRNLAWVRERLHGVPASTLRAWLRGEGEPPRHVQGMALEILRGADRHPAVRSSES